MDITVQKGELWTSVTATAEEIEASAYIRSVISMMLGAPVEVITPVVKAEPAEPKQKTPRKDAIDYGKVRALWDAKWNVAKIADEIGCSEQSIRNYLKKQGLIN